MSPAGWRKPACSLAGSKWSYFGVHYLVNSQIYCMVDFFIHRSHYLHWLPKV